MPSCKKSRNECTKRPISRFSDRSRLACNGDKQARRKHRGVQRAGRRRHRAHLIVAHEVTNVAVDRTLLAPMAAKAKAAMRTDTLEALADRGYYSGEQLLAC